MLIWSILKSHVTLVLSQAKSDFKLQHIETDKNSQQQNPPVGMMTLISHTFPFKNNLSADYIVNNQ